MFGELKPCKCIVCGTKAFSQQDYNCMASFYDCPVCGRYELILNLQVQNDAILPIGAKNGAMNGAKNAKMVIIHMGILSYCQRKM